MKTYHFTKDGYENLKKEQEQLREERKDAVMHLKKAREMGDLSENGYYKASKMKLSSIDHRLFKLSVFLKYGKIIEPKKSDTVDLGSTVTLKDGEQTVIYTIVGSEEANPREGRISNESPIGKALIGKKVHEAVSLITPSKTTTYTIEKIV